MPAAEVTHTLSRIRGRYLPVDDRLLLTADLAGGGEDRFWLTRRMMAQVLPPVTGYLEKAAAGDLDRLLDEVRAGLARAQADAARRRAADPDVAPSFPPEAWVVTRVNLSSMPTGCRLVFAGPAGGPQASIVLPPVSLCRWLLALYAQCETAAQWCLPTWPAWMPSLLAVQMPSARDVVH